MQGRGQSVLRPLAVMLLPVIGYEWLRSSAEADVMVHSPAGHFYIVSIIAALALFVALAVGATGHRLRNIKIVFLSLAYVSLAEVFLLHGLSTPGLLMHDKRLAGFAAQLSIMLAVFWLSLSATSSDHPIVRLFTRFRSWLIPCWVALLGGFCAAALGNPALVQAVPLNEEPTKWFAAAATGAGCLWAIYRYWLASRASEFPLQRALVYGSALLLVSQYIMATGETWRLSWWLYHVLLLGSMIVMLAGLYRQYFSRGAFRSSLRLLFQKDPRGWLDACMTPSIRALITATEIRDAYTAGHNRRVALYALRLAEMMELATDRLRAIAQGGVVHDVGKLKVPDAILNKPGKLTAEERTVIESHPASGYDMCRRLGFLSDELAVIRSHHEKWDGTGYPDRLAGEDIPLLARITAVADVYDALTSSRSYRKAMSHEEAMAIIAEGSGSHFDPACVAAWMRLGREDPDFFREVAEEERAKPPARDRREPAEAGA